MSGDHNMYASGNQPAFPGRMNIGYDGSFNEGMTLRDYFAAKAMQGFISATRKQLSASDIDPITKSSYILADAMIQARGESK